MAPHGLAWHLAAHPTAVCRSAAGRQRAAKAVAEERARGAALVLRRSDDAAAATSEWHVWRIRRVETAVPRAMRQAHELTGLPVAVGENRAEQFTDAVPQGNGGYSV